MTGPNGLNRDISTAKNHHNSVVIKFSGNKVARYASKGSESDKNAFQMTIVSF